MELRSGNVQMSMGSFSSNNKSSMTNNLKVNQAAMMKPASSYARSSVVMNATSGSEAAGSDTSSFRITGELSYLDAGNQTDYFDKSFQD